MRNILVLRAPGNLRRSFTLLLGALVLVVMAAAMRPSPSALVLEAIPNRLPGDGFSSVKLRLRSENGAPVRAGEVQFVITEGARRARIEGVSQSEDGAEAILRAGVLPGVVVVEARAKGRDPVRVRVETYLADGDTFGDGTPDILRLDSSNDRTAFRRWFTFLAEWQYALPPARREAEISDCAALLRFAYREALREHDGEWASRLGLVALPASSSPEKYHYPFTPLGAALFRTSPGPYRASDLEPPGAFAEFADAQTLRRYNTHFVSRDLRDARPGDLLFFRQIEQRMPFHAMIYVGQSQITEGRERWLVYHSGPSHRAEPFGRPARSPDDAGEMRRITVEELERYPLPQWRPLPGNPGFLGVYRWNILRGEE